MNLPTTPQTTRQIVELDIYKNRMGGWTKEFTNQRWVPVAMSVKECDLRVGDKIRLFEGAFGDAIVTEISCGKIYVLRPFLFGLGCSEPFTMGTEKMVLHTDSDKLWTLLSREE